MGRSLIGSSNQHGVHSMGIGQGPAAVLFWNQRGITYYCKAKWKYKEETNTGDMRKRGVGGGRMLNYGM